MFENRARGAQLVKRISYFYLIIAVLVVIAIFALGLNVLIVDVPFYAIMFVALYLLSTKFQDNKNTWIIVVIIAIITIVWTLSLLGVVLTILLIVGANDMKKELKEPQQLSE